MKKSQAPRRSHGNDALDLFGELLTFQHPRLVTKTAAFQRHGWEESLRRLLSLYSQGLIIPSSGGRVA